VQSSPEVVGMWESGWRRGKGGLGNGGARGKGGGRNRIRGGDAAFSRIDPFEGSDITDESLFDLFYDFLVLIRSSLLCTGCECSTRVYTGAWVGSFLWRSKYSSIFNIIFLEVIQKSSDMTLEIVRLPSKSKTTAIGRKTVPLVKRNSFKEIVKVEFLTTINLSILLFRNILYI
jgi:hypothetical protein